ncbi:SDR family oxidoreductase [Robertkochia aurantiaca]|uniref:SDR family oxidoreductase n=1 Tax=Robertkochia aurantiaca TaxID=2873700 RepID=UPI001CC96B59|nr:SDR family oxidoreductase [Robertkochia sp. 3YJGBD-33]
MEKVLVAGATGTTGNIIVHLLKESDNYEPVAMVRKKEQTAQFQAKGIETVLADLTEDVSHAVKGTGKVIFAAGSKGKNLEEVDKEGAKKLVDAAEKHGLKKFVMLSSIGADDPESHSELSDYLKAKKSADEHLRNSSISYTIVRPGQLSNDEGTGKIRYGKSIDHKGDIPRADVAKTLVTALDESKADHKTFEILKGDTPIEEALKKV